jgi:hypothetical protein
MSLVTAPEAANDTKVSNTPSAGMMYIAECFIQISIQNISAYNL